LGIRRALPRQPTCSAFHSLRITLIASFGNRFKRFPIRFRVSRRCARCL
jgi:hypothetical protein